MDRLTWMKLVSHTIDYVWKQHFDLDNPPLCLVYSMLELRAIEQHQLLMSIYILTFLKPYYSNKREEEEQRRESCRSCE